MSAYVQFNKNWKAEQSLKIIFSSSSTAHILSTYSLDFCCLFKKQVLLDQTNSLHVVPYK